MKLDWQHYRRRLDRFSERLGAWKAVAAVAVAVALLWSLHPSRQLDTGATPGDTVEITYFGLGGPVQGAMEDVVREFERLSREAHAADPSKPAYCVISGQNASRDQTADPTRFLVSVAGGMAPDVIWFDRFAVAEWAARGAFEPLDRYIAGDLAAGRPDAVRPERWYECCWDEAVFDGKVYGIPADVDDRALMYNRDLLVRAGLVGEEGRAKPPADWDELKKYAVWLSEWVDKEKTVISGPDMLRRVGLVDDSDNPRMPRDWGEVQRLKAEARKHTLRVCGFAPNYGNSFLYIYGWMAGAEFMSADRKTCRLNSPEVVRALAYMREVYDLLGGYQAVNEFQAGFQGGELDPFIQGKVVMKIDGSWQMSNLPAYARDLDFGVAGPPLPKSELAKGRKTVSFNGGWAFVIPSVAKNKDAAWEFVRFLASDRAFWIMRESQRATAEAMGRLFIPRQAASKDLNEASFEKYVYSNELIPPKYRDGSRVFNDLMEYARHRPVTPVGQRLWKAHVDATEIALLDNDKARVAQGPSAIARAALDVQTEVVQREIERFTKPPEGGEVSLGWFFVAYPVLLILFAGGVFLWDTNARFRARLARLFRLGTSGDAVIEGARGGYFRKQWWGGVVCALPWIVGFVVFAGGPMLFSILMSFCDYDILNPPRFVGLENYKLMFAGDGLFYTALWNTLFMVIGVPLGMAASLSIALLLNLKIRGVSVWRTFFYLPAIVPMVAASVMWVVIFNPQGGLVNRFLDLIGLEGPGWLQSASWSKPSLILMGLWSAGGGMLIWLAGLKGIPEQLYEAASVDGAGVLQKFRHVTIPQLTPYIFFNLIMGFIGTFQIFASAFIMTAGGPRNSTLFFVYHLFNNAFRYGHMGYASAMAWVLFVIVLLLTIVQIKLSKRWVYYESD